MRLVLCPGYVTSKTDGDRHFVDENELARLYGVAREDCTVRKVDDEGFQPLPGDMMLNPRYDGKYPNLSRFSVSGDGIRGLSLDQAWRKYSTECFDKVGDPLLYVIEQSFWIGACATMNVLMEIPADGAPDREQTARFTRAQQLIIENLRRVAQEGPARMKIADNV